MYLNKENQLWIAGKDIYLNPKMANRHGLITGATGTGKTVTLKVLAEGFSEMGVPVFLSDIKGDLSGFLSPVHMGKTVTSRVEDLNIEGFNPQTYPVTFYDVFKKNGIPLRARVSDVGPELLSRLLNLTDTQAAVLTLIFKIADDLGWLLIDLKDLRSMIQYVADHRQEYSQTYGQVSSQSAGAIQRALMRLESDGGDDFFGEPAFEIADWFRCDASGKGMINVLSCSELFQHPLLYATVMLYLVDELYEEMQECGDLDKPKMVFFFDEAHVLFNDAPKALKDKIVQVIKLIRSKGVGIYFISQSPSDLPDPVLAQLGNRIQHALRAYTPNEQKALRVAAKSFRANEAFDTEQVLQELGVGEALVSCLDDQGVPMVVQRAFVLPPQSFMGKVEDESLVKKCIQSNPLNQKYLTDVDRESAFEKIASVNKQEQLEEQKAQKAKEKAKAKPKQTTRSSSRRKSSLEKGIDAAFVTIGREIGKSIQRSLFGTRKR